MRWEYRAITHLCTENREIRLNAIDEERARELNVFGAEGWELVAVVPVVYDDVMRAATYVFKRARQ